MKLYEVTEYNNGWPTTAWIDPKMIFRVSKSGKIQIDRSPFGDGKPADLETVSEQSVWVCLAGGSNHSYVRITWDTWQKLRVAAGIEVEVL